MDLDDKIEQLEDLILEVRQASLSDDKTILGSSLAFRREARAINQGKSEFNVIVFGDLDDFKQINDEHGHDTGDVAIRAVGDAIGKIVIEELQCKAFRLSGDEFVILLRADSVERFVSAVPSFRNILFSHNEKKLRTGMSIGYARGDGKTSISDLLERAEIACQHAKAKGETEPVEWTESIKHNPLVRLSDICETCGARISCNVPKLRAPAALQLCPCCCEAL
jgi:diguanylate cyclase (GGDEF)-like protein